MTPGVESEGDPCPRLRASERAGEAAVCIQALTITMTARAGSVPEKRASLMAKGCSDECSRSEQWGPPGRAFGGRFFSFRKITFFGGEGMSSCERKLRMSGNTSHVHHFNPHESEADLRQRSDMPWIPPDFEKTYPRKRKGGGPGILLLFLFFVACAFLMYVISLLEQEPDRLAPVGSGDVHSAALCAPDYRFVQCAKAAMGHILFLGQSHQSSQGTDVPVGFAVADRVPERHAQAPERALHRLQEHLLVLSPTLHGSRATFGELGGLYAASAQHPASMQHEVPAQWFSVHHSQAGRHHKIIVRPFCGMVIPPYQTTSRRLCRSSRSCSAYQTASATARTRSS